jgi:hypothetical protein
LLARLIVVRPGLDQLRVLCFLAAWLVFLALLSLFAARLITSRYFMPVSGPLALLLAYVFVQLWESWKPVWSRLLLRGAILAGMSAWFVLFALPFIYAALTEPLTVPLSGTNAIEYESGFLTADAAIREAAAKLNTLEPPDEPVYATWNLCHLLYFYAERQIQCLKSSNPREQLASSLQTELVACGAVYLALRGYSPFFGSIGGIDWEEVFNVKSPRIPRDVWAVKVWRLWSNGC